MASFEETPSEIRYKSSAQPVKSTFDLKVPIQFPGAILKYYLGTDAYDISFSLIFINEFQEESVLVSETRVGHDEPLIGEHVFKNSKGFAVLKFDNTYSWWRAKSLSYHVSVNPPDLNKLRTLRTIETRRKLLNTNEDLVRAERRRRRTQETALGLKEKLDTLQHEMEVLQMKITANSKSFREIEQESSWLSGRIEKQRHETIPSLVFDLVLSGGWLETRPSLDLSSVAINH